MRHAPSIPWVFVVLVTAALAGFQHGCSPGRPRDGAPRTDPSSALAKGDTAAALRVLAVRAGDRSAPPETFLLLGRLYRSRGSIADRLRAQETFENGLRRYPDHSDLLAELGATYYAQTLYGDAERVFRRLLEIDPSRCDAHYYLGTNAYRKWKRVQSYTDYLDTAELFLSVAVACDTTREDAYLKLAFSRCVLGDTALALEVCAAYRAAHPPAPEPLFLSGCVAYASGDYTTCRDRFDEALSLLGEKQRMIYTHPSLLLSAGDEKDDFDSAPLPDKIEKERWYWIANDPDPTTEINERLLEHVCRVFLSGLRYESSTPPVDGWDTSRGKALIKFGEPDHIETTLKGVRPMDGRTEIWTYLETEEPFILFFRDEYLNGNYGIPIEDVISAWTLREDPPLTAHVPDAAEIPGTLEAFAFRESETTTSVFVVYAVNADSLDRHLWSWHTERFRTRTAVFLEDGRPHGFFADELPADSLVRNAAATPPLYVALEGLSLPFGAYRVAFCLEDSRQVARSIAWAEVATSRFIGESLSASDLVLGSAARHESLSIPRHGRTLPVNPTARYLPGESLLLNLELYNLGLRNGRSAYELSYSIRRVDSRHGLWNTLKSSAEKIGIASRLPPPVVSQAFGRVGTSDTADEEIVVGIDSLEPGGYEITVTAADTATRETVSVSKRFVKIGGSPSGRE